MRILLTIFMLSTFVLKSQTFKYNLVTDLENECKCKSKIVIKEKKVIVRYKNLNVNLKLDEKTYLKKEDKFILKLTDNKYHIQKIILCESSSVFVYNDGRKSIRFLNTN